MLNSAVSNAQFEIKNLEKQAYLYQNEPFKYPGISSKELQSRIDKIDKAVTKIKELDITVRMAVSGGGGGVSSSTNYV
jgi:hypothetical protein